MRQTPVSVRLVDWADEEGAVRHEPFSDLQLAQVTSISEARRRKTDSIALIDVLAEHGIDFDRLKDSGKN